MENPRAVVVVAEDEPDARELLATLIRRAGYEVLEADDGPALVSSVHALCASDIQPMAIVTDIDMPRQTGLEATRTLRDRGVDVPIVFVTGEQEPGLLEQARALGVDVLIKPIDPARLRTILSKLGANASGAANR